MQYDLLVMGDGLTALRGAIAAARLGRRVGWVRSPSAGELSQPVGQRWESRTALRAAFRRMLLRHGSGRLQQHWSALATAIDLERHDEWRALYRSEALQRVDIFTSDGWFVDPQRIAIHAQGRTRILSGRQILLTSATTPRIADDWETDGEAIVDPEHWLRLPSLPASMLVVGAGSIGLEAAIMLATVGVSTTVIDRKRHLFPGAGDTADRQWWTTAQKLGIQLCLGRQVRDLERCGADEVSAYVDGGRVLTANKALVAIGRTTPPARWNLPAAGLRCNREGRIIADAAHRTRQPHILVTPELRAQPRRRKPLVRPEPQESRPPRLRLYVGQ